MRGAEMTEQENNMDIAVLLAFAEKLADASGEIIRKYFRAGGEVAAKQDLSPVTIADIEVERALRRLIQEEYPDHGLIGEEYGIKNEDAEYKWVIDPIDGTMSFIAGRPIFGTLISLVHAVSPVLGIIDQPIIGERWVGVPGEFASFKGEAASVRKCKSLGEAVLCTTAPGYFKTDDLIAFAKVSNEARYTMYGGDCYNYGLLASGHVDVVIETGLKPHDFCALAAVVEAAGGIMTNWEGKPLTLYSDGRVLAAGSRRVHAEALQILRGDAGL